MNRNIYKRLALTGWLLLAVSVGAWAQIGNWRSHVSYRSARSVAVVADYVYVATANGLFAYDKTTSELVTLTRQDGLTDGGISRLLYLPDQSRLLIAYRTGTIDFLTVGQGGAPGSVTTTISTIATATNLPDARGINFISRVDNLAYLSTDFGLVVLNLTANDIRDTYFSQRTNGSPVPIYQTTILGDSLYALTAPVATTGTVRAIRAVRYSGGTNLADPGNWRLITSPPGSPETLVTRQGRVSATVNGRGIYDRVAGQWTLSQPLLATPLRQFATGSSANANVIVAAGSTITAPTAGSSTGSLLVDPRDAVADGTMLWIADAQQGLLQAANGTIRSSTPSAGPDRDLFSALFAYPDRLIALPNAPRDTTRLPVNTAPANELQVSANQWQAVSAQGLDRGFTSAAYQADTQTLYLGGFGTGLWQQTADQPTLVAVALPATISNFITSLATDVSGNLWIATGGATVPTTALHVRRPDGTFTSFPAVTVQVIEQLVPDEAGYIWMRLSVGNGLLVFDPQTNNSRTLTTAIGGGGLLTNNVRALAKDRQGAMWVGTDLGPTVFDNLSDPFTGAINAQAPFINGRRLLLNELVTAIAVDGGNRKWLSTRTGLYRVSPDGSQLLESFTDATTPLPLRSVSALAIDPPSGRLFVQTANGIISYQTIATEPADVLSSPTIFPNPVRPDFTGSVGISGLIDNATVKIMDAGGQLVYETRSQGGTATWNLIDYRGRSVQTGVYLVVVVASDGSEGVAGKLAVVR